MAERTFNKGAGALCVGAGQEFKGEAILAAGKALLQSGVSYISTYQSAPVAGLTDALSAADGLLDDLGVSFVMSANEAAAVAALAASVNYPLRGAAIFQGPAGAAVAAPALANLASSGVTGGALIVVGEDYGQGSPGTQERSHALAMKSQIWLLDPRPNLPSIVSAVENGFALSEASNSPVMLTLKRRACHLYGTFEAKDNVRAGYRPSDALNAPHRGLGRIVVPPGSHLQEREKIEKRLPAAVRFIEKRQLNEIFQGEADGIGLVVQGGLYNALIQALQALGLADEFGESRIPLYVLNVTYPLIEGEVLRFCEGKRAVLMIEEGQPEFVEQGLHTILSRAGSDTHLEGKGMLPLAGEYTGSVIKAGVTRFLKVYRAELLPPETERPAELAARRAAQAVAPHLRPRTPSFCPGCPERPVFSAIKLTARQLGDFHVSCDIGCHLYSAQPPLNTGNTTMGYGLGGAATSALAPGGSKPAISILGDGGFWHNGLLSSIGTAVFNKTANVHIVVDNGYSAAGGGQRTLSSAVEGRHAPARWPIEEALRAIGVRWVWTMPDTYDIKRMRTALREAFATPESGPKVIVARSECMRAQASREGPLTAARLKRGERVVRHRFGTDPDVCSGDHTCIRLSGCPSLTIAPNPSPLNLEPVTKVTASCTGCGLCGEIAHAAVLCPSYFRATIVRNPSIRDRLLAWFRNRVISYFQRRLERSAPALGGAAG
jgi:indolepyruvate ferredoxin oxidoreductase alpha subunit